MVVEEELTIINILEHYTFIDWYLDEDYLNKFSSSTLLTENITLYAKYERNQFKIIWNTGTKKIEQIIYAGEKIEVPEEIKKEGFILTGWKNYETDMLMPEKDMEFTAIWVEKTTDNPETGVTDNLLVSPIIMIISIAILIFVKKNILYKYDLGGRL